MQLDCIMVKRLGIASVWSVCSGSGSFFGTSPTEALGGLPSSCNAIPTIACMIYIELEISLFDWAVGMTHAESESGLAKQALRNAGLRATAARIAVFKLLSSEGGPMSHAEVVEALEDFGFDQSTLFRCLNEIADAGLIARLDLGDHTRRFELRESNEVDPHPHFMCVDCGELTCMNDFSLQITPSRGPRRAKLGTITEVLIRGHCGTCESR